MRRERAAGGWRDRCGRGRGSGRGRYGPARHFFEPFFAPPPAAGLAPVLVPPCSSVLLSTQFRQQGCIPWRPCHRCWSWSSAANSSVETYLNSLRTALGVGLGLGLLLGLGGHCGGNEQVLWVVVTEREEGQWMMERNKKQEYGSCNLNEKALGTGYRQTRGARKTFWTARTQVAMARLGPGFWPIWRP